MQKLIITAIILAGFFSSVQCQSDGWWSDPVAVTDSVSYNTNAKMLLGTSILFYEKKSNLQSPSGIFCVDLYSNCCETEVLNDDSIIYRNPVPISINNNDHYLLYESNENGNFDIYILEFDLDCNFGDSYQLTNSIENENSLDYNHSRIIYLFESKVCTANLNFSNDSIYLSEFTYIDTLQSANPVSGYNIIYWQRFEIDEYHIYKSNWENNSWSDPEPVFLLGDNINLTFTKYFFEYEDIDLPVWENNGYFLCYNSYYNKIDTIEISGAETISQPSSFYYYILTLEYCYIPALSFTTGSGEEQEIFIRDFYSATIIENISNNNVKDSHSELCYGPYDNYSWEWYCIWESEINNHIVLYYSEQTVIWGDIAENKSSLMEIYPNPFKSELIINSKIKNSPAIIEIYSLAGDRIYYKETENGEAVKWNPEKQSDNVADGVYLIKIIQGKLDEIKKVVYQK
jgi:hypothetical protein